MSVTSAVETQTAAAAPPAQNSGSLAPLPAPEETRPRRAERLVRGPYRAPDGLRRFMYSGAILYTTHDEDTTSELTAFELTPEHRVMCVTGSGCRTLNLLIGGPREIVSVDANPLQNWLLELKVEGMRELDHAGFLEFMGVRESDRRAAVYGSVRERLSPPARRFWDRNVHVIADGVLFSGAHESYYRTVLSPLVLGARRSKVDALFSYTDIEEQRRFYHREWNTGPWRAAIRMAMRPSMFKLGIRDPSYYQHVEMDEAIGDYCLRRLEHTMTTVPARDNHFLSLLFLGRYVNEQAMPLYLLEQHYETVRSRLDAIRIETAMLDQHLATQPAGSYDRYSLSDVSGWTDPGTFTTILALVVATARPGARFVYRNFVTKRSIPAALHHSIDPRPGIARALEETDLAFGFTFEVGDVRRDGATA